jgi:hypothetical protein
MVWALALVGTFRWNAALSAASRLFVYGTVCAALPVLRKKLPGQEGLHLPGGLVFAVLGIAFALILVSRMGIAELIALAITAVVSFLNWVVVRGNTPSLIPDRLFSKVRDANPRFRRNLPKLCPPCSAVRFGKSSQVSAGLTKKLRTANIRQVVFVDKQSFYKF